MTVEPPKPARKTRSIPRAEGVGSLLRAPRITAAIDQLYAGKTTGLHSLILQEKPSELRAFNALADAEVRQLVQRQIDAGLDVVTDGELRRVTFLSSFYDSVEGMAAAAERFQVKDENGQVTYEGYGEPVVQSPLQKAHSPLAEEATFLRAVTDFPFKVTLPAPSYFLTHFVEIPKVVYPDRRALVAAVVALERQIVAEAIAAGARWLQFDFPVYPGMVDADYTAQMLKDAGVADRKALLDIALEADAAVVKGIPSDVTVALHLCRGNLTGGFWSGSLAPIAEAMFNRLPHQRFLFEWEDVAREGDYAPIKYVPKDRIMAMGLISTKTPELEPIDDVLRRLDAAAKFLPMDQLAICPQCGFASLCGDHLVEAEDAQWRKLELVGQIANRVWGSA